MKKVLNLIQNEYSRKILGSAIIAICFIIVILLFYKADLKDTIVDHITHVINVDEEQFIYDFTEDMHLSSKFSSPAAFDYITLSISNHDKVIAGKTIVEIWEENGESPLLHQEIVNTDIHATGPYKIYFTDAGGGKKEHIYEIRISAVDTESAAIGFFGYQTEAKGEPAMLNGSPTEYSLSVGCHTQSGRFMVLVMSMLFVCSIMIITITFFIHHPKVKEEFYFLLLGCGGGIAMFLLLSINPVNDPTFQYASTYQYSNALLGIKDEESDHTMMRLDDRDMIESFQPAKTFPRFEPVYEYSRVIDEFAFLVKNDTLVRSAQHQDVSEDAILSKLPAVLGLTLGRLLHLGAYPCLYLARIFSFLFYILAGFYAVRKTPIAKMGFVFVLTLPSVIRPATGITYDSMATITAFVIAALSFKMYKTRLNRKEIAVLWISALLIGSCKGGVYIPILLLTLLIVVSSEYSRKEKWLLPLITCGLGGVSYALNNPLTFLAIQIRSLLEYADTHIGSFFGNGALWISGDGVIPWVVILIFTVLLILSAIQTKENFYQIDYRMRIGCWVVVLGIIVGINLAFMGVTPLGDTRLWGVQGRYYLPLAPLLFILLRCNGLYYEVGYEKRLYLYWTMAEILFLYYYVRNIFFVI